MEIDLRQPNISGSDHEMLLGLKSYLFQLREQLQWAFDNLDMSSSGSGGSGNAPVSNTTIINSTSVPSNEKDAKATFDAIKSFIIGSADIVNAYYDEVNSRLQGIYVAQSEYGDFVQTTESRLNATSDRIDQNYSNVQTIIVKTDDLKGRADALDEAFTAQTNEFNEALTEVGETIDEKVAGAKDEIGKTVSNVQTNLDKLETDLEGFTRIITTEGEGDTKVISIGVQGLIRSGLLGYENSIPIYGVEVGQSVGVPGEAPIYRANAQFRPDKLAFYNSNGDMESYIGQQKLSIINGEVDKTFKRGDLVDEVKTSGIHAGDVVTKWEE